MSSYNAAGNVQFTYAQLEGIWTQAGGSSQAAPIAAAIAMAESGGNSTATDDDSNGSVDRGLWQINSVHGAQSTYDVMGNARAAIAISNNGQNWSPWTTYTNGAYRQFLQTNVAPDTSAPINGTNATANATLTDYPGGWLDPLNYLDPWGLFQKAAGLPSDITGNIDRGIATALQNVIISILNPFINMAAGIMGIGAGAVMVLVGIFMMVKNTEAGRETTGAVGQAAAAGMSFAGPEATAATEYMGAEGQVTKVSQTRRPAGQFKIGGRPIRYRQATVRTTVERPKVTQKTTAQTLRDESRPYVKRNGPNQ